jgi:hypothetical protein
MPMTETQQNIRDSLLTTLAFLASESQQKEFAAKVHYDSYEDEFACWWFDTFFPDEPDALEMFTSKQLAALEAFSSAFDECLREVGCEARTIEQLQARIEWRFFTAVAEETLAKVGDAT